MVEVRNLADYIEEHIKKLISLSGNNAIELKRKELALKFDCVPSQINYVLATRFTPTRGYLVESRRGGGGYLKIMKLVFSREEQLKNIWHRLDRGLDNRGSLELLDWLFEEKAITLREKKILQAAVSLLQEMEEDSGVNKEMIKRYRTEFFKNLLAVLASQ